MKKIKTISSNIDSVELSVEKIYNYITQVEAEDIKFLLRVPK